MPTRNINIDSLDKPNGPGVPMPENKSRRGYVERPTFRWELVLLFCSVPGVLLIGILFALWKWAEYQLQWGTGLDYALAFTFKFVVVMAFPTALLGGVVLMLLRGYWGVQHSRILRMQNDQPVDVVDVLSAPNRPSLTASQMTEWMRMYYGVEGRWADASSYRNMNGSYSPTFQNAQPPMLGADGGGDDGGDPPIAIMPPNGGVSLSEAGDGSAGVILQGAGPGGNVIRAPIGQAYHSLRQGDTGTGKTTSLNAELVQIHKMAVADPRGYELYAGDFKGEFQATWGTSPLFIGGINTEPESIAAMLEENMEEIHDRYRMFADVAEQSKTLCRNAAEYEKITGQSLPYRLVYLDEINVLLGGTIPRQVRARVDAALKRGLQLGRGARVFYECGAQYMTADLFDREGSKQFVTRFYFGSWDHTAINMVFMGKIDQEWVARYKPAIDGRPGRGIYAGPGQPPIPIQGPFVTAGEIIDSIEQVRMQSAMSSGMRPGTRESIFTGPGSGVVYPGVAKDVSSDQGGFQGFSNDVLGLISNPAVRQYLILRGKALKAEGKDKKGVIYSLFGARPGKTQSYQVASTFYDQEIRNG